MGFSTSQSTQSGIETWTNTEARTHDTITFRDGSGHGDLRVNWEAPLCPVFRF